MNLASYLPKPSLDARLMGAHRLSVLTDDALFQKTGTRIAFTNRHGGVSLFPYASLNLGSHVGDDPECVVENRHRVLEALGADADAPLIVPNQVHQTSLVSLDDKVACRCACVDAADPAPNAPFALGADGPRVCDQDGVDVSLVDPRQAADVANGLAAKGADALVVRSLGVAALMNFADCTPVIVVSPSGAFAIAHAGWRGAVAGVSSTAVRKLVESDLEQAGSPGFPAMFEKASFAEAAAACNVYIGPHIQVECFETGADVADLFRERFASRASAVVPDHRHVDLSQAVIADLLEVGIDPDRICDCGICTKCNHDDYFSYRAESGRCGRHAGAAIRLKGGLHGQRD